MKLNSHKAHLRSQTKNQSHSRTLCLLTTLSKLSRSVLWEELNCLCFARFVRLGTTYIVLHLFITLIHSLTNLVMHSLSFEVGQRDSWKWSGISCACWKVSSYNIVCMHGSSPDMSKNLVSAQMTLHSSYLALTPSPSPFSSLLKALSFGLTFPSPSPTPSTISRSKRGWHPTSVCGYSATPQSKHSVSDRRALLPYCAFP